MNLLKFSFLALLLIGFTACSDDDDTTCELTDWAGVYTGGNETCVDGETGPTTITVTVSGSTLSLVASTVYTSGNTAETSLGGMTVNGCTATVSETEDGITATFTATLDGKNISVSEKAEDATGVITDCSYSGTRS